MNKDNEQREKTENQIIADFMELECPRYLPSGKTILDESDLKYHESWDWLMPVVEKIESLDNRAYGFTIDPWGMVIIEYASGNEEEIVSFQNDDDYPKIQQYYHCVVEFIKKYQSKSAFDGIK